MPAVSFILLLLALLLILRIEHMVLHRIGFAFLELGRGLLFLLSLGRIRLRPRLMAVGHQRRTTMKNFKYWLEDRKHGDLIEEDFEFEESDPYDKWVTGDGKSGAVSALDNLKKIDDDDFSHLQD